MFLKLYINHEEDTASRKLKQKELIHAELLSVVWVISSSVKDTLLS